MQLEPAILAFDGVLGLRGIGALHARLLQAFTEHAAIQIDCANAESIDAGFIQLLIAARRSAEAEGVSLLIPVPADSVLHRALARCGLPPDTLSGPTAP
jgi:two-component system chemotaxis sensor kinase CheA